MALLAFIIIFGIAIVIFAVIEEGKRSHSIHSAREEKLKRENWLGLEGMFLIGSGVFMYFQDNPYHGYTRAKHFILSRFLARVNGVPYDRIDNLLDGISRLNGQNELLGGFGNNTFFSSDVSSSQGAVILHIDTSTLANPVFESLATHNSITSDAYQPLIRICSQHAPLLEDKQDWLKINATAITDIGSENLHLNSFRIYLSMTNMPSGSLPALEEFIRETHGYKLCYGNGSDIDAIRAVYELVKIADWVGNEKQKCSSSLFDATKTKERALAVPGSEQIMAQIEDQLQKFRRELEDFEVMERETSQNSKDIFNYIACRQMLAGINSQAGRDVNQDQISAKVEKAREIYASALSLGFTPNSK